MAQSREAARLLEAGVTLADPARIDVRGALDCGRDVSIDVNCVFEGKVRLGERRAHRPALRAAQRHHRRRAARCARFRISTTPRSARAACVGPYARLRPGASLAEDVHIGNFVEVKASRVGKGSKANHLSYIGDADVGANVNIGAGTITCNYDGANKNRTVIEDDCFIGSDATLVAPVRIARGSYIGAGSTISKNTPAGQLTVARARQMSIPAWKPPKKTDRRRASAMCGIVGAAARRDIVPVLVEGLRRLEYRGYDSCGVAVLDGDGIERIRSVERVADLAKQIKGSKVQRRDRHRAHALGDARRAGDEERAPDDVARRDRGGAQRHHRELRGAARRAEGEGLRVRQPDRHRGHRPPDPQPLSTATCSRRCDAR